MLPMLSAVDGLPQVGTLGSRYLLLISQIAPHREVLERRNQYTSTSPQNILLDTTELETLRIVHIKHCASQRRCNRLIIVQQVFVWFILHRKPWLLLQIQRWYCNAVRIVARVVAADERYTPRANARSSDGFLLIDYYLRRRTKSGRYKDRHIWVRIEDYALLFSLQTMREKKLGKKNLCAARGEHHLQQATLKYSR